MFQGKVKQALNLLTTNTGGGPLHLEDKVDGEQSVRDILRDKPPPGRPAHQDSLSREAPPYIHPMPCQPGLEALDWLIQLDVLRKKM